MAHGLHAACKSKTKTLIVKYLLKTFWYVLVMCCPKYQCIQNINKKNKDRNDIYLIVSENSLPTKLTHYNVLP